MLFSSVSFLYYFIPVVFFIYMITPRRGKNIVLLFASLFFYAYGGPKYTILMIGSCLVAYIAGLGMDRFKGTKGKKVIFILGVGLSVFSLGFFKYTDFFLSNINSIFHTDFPLLKIALPIGISFYTFQLLSYLIDVYYGKVAVQKSFIKLAAYISFFPQLIAGPIVRYSVVENELDSRKFTFEQFSYGMHRFVIGLGKKVLIANQLGELCVLFRASDEKSVLFYWMYAIAYTLQIYFDFSGYSDMAIGLGRIFGFHFLENFNYPYISKSISEFWRRWHISLGSWFRDYIYIPLGGNRVSTWKWFRNILVVWFLTGFWHGANWNFIVWGLYFAILLMLEKICFHKFSEKLPKFVAHLYVMFLIVISFVIFNAESMSQAWQDLKGMVGMLSVPLTSVESIYYLKSNLIIYIIGIIGCTPFMGVLIKRCKEYRWCEILFDVIEPFVYLILIIVVTSYLVDGSFNPFLYFRF